MGADTNMSGCTTNCKAMGADTKMGGCTSGCFGGNSSGGSGGGGGGDDDDDDDAGGSGGAGGNGGGDCCALRNGWSCPPEKSGNRGSATYNGHKLCCPSSDIVIGGSPPTCGESYEIAAE